MSRPARPRASRCSAWWSGLPVSPGWRRRRWCGGCGFLAIVALLVAPWFFWVSRAPRPAADSLYAYYAFYTLGKTAAGDFGAWLGQHAAIALANARYLAGTFELLYLIPL